jgi:hypothetical protein
LDLIMAMDRSGRWWIGEDVAGVEEYLREYTADGYPAEEIRQCTCGTCGGRVFGLRGDVDEGSARRTCRNCGAKHFIADSAETWPQSSPRTSTCVCGSNSFNLAVAYAREHTAAG